MTYAAVAVPVVIAEGTGLLGSVATLGLLMSLPWPAPQAITVAAQPATWVYVIKDDGGSTTALYPDGRLQQVANNRVHAHAVCPPAQVLRASYAARHPGRRLRHAPRPGGGQVAAVCMQAAAPLRF